ncbi:hypothetical protein BU26DRAFT_507871 [Trematosphaeria pertusa]|uniref:Uncharacterized protein n=1 Tax=Trematosphaeria pertusa TaxID=390896 RepID=A0A6A6I9Q8_9PLEO|nr:uncharacterized protein BU26DRAFT_507871 [Trematosphaeria pertusa]KAF2246263.1 hypothetical protein BU26DRAFT_507871 [Trematosphaeria pertusa]
MSAPRKNWRDALQSFSYTLFHRFLHSYTHPESHYHTFQRDLQPLLAAIQTAAPYSLEEGTLALQIGEMTGTLAEGFDDWAQHYAWILGTDPAVILGDFGMREEGKRESDVQRMRERAELCERVRVVIVEVQGVLNALAECSSSGEQGFE